MNRLLSSFFFLSVLLCAACASLPEGERRVAEVKKRIQPRLQSELRHNGQALGDPVFIRIFKESSELELWLSDAETGSYRLFKTYPVCNYSGVLGPKIMEGDKQAPEGFYSVSAARLNPESRYHLSFNIGYPNAYDRSLRRTGNFVMVHGDCRSIGCYAMTDKQIEEIYLIALAALQSSQAEIPVHIFPFRMDDDGMKRHADSDWTEFWGNLQTGYKYFDENHLPPQVSAQNGRYIFFANRPGDHACLNCLSM